MLADLHSVDVGEVGLDGLGRPDGFLERQVRLWWRQSTEVKTHDLADATRLHGVLVASLPSTPGRIGIVHGDYRIDNTLLAFDDISKVLAVVDGSSRRSGTCCTDVALMCVYRQPELDAILGVEAAWASDRLPSGDALAQTYAGLRGVSLDHWPFYVALANFKLAVIAGDQLLGAAGRRSGTRARRGPTRPCPSCWLRGRGPCPPRAGDGRARLLTRW